VAEHTSAPLMDREDPAPGTTWMVGVLGVVLFVIVVLGITAMLYTAREAEFEQKVTEVDVLEYETLTSEQAARLDGPARREIVQDQYGNVQSEAIVIPVEDAVDIIAEAY